MILVSIIHFLKRSISSTYRFSVDNLYMKPYWTIKLILHPSTYCVHKSYYPDKKSKSSKRIWFEQLGQTWRFGSPNQFYFPYGLDVKTKAEQEEYLHYIPFSKLRSKASISEQLPIIILRDKLYFGMFADYLGIKSAKNIAISNKKELLDLSTKRNIPIEDFILNYDNGNYFVKPIDGQCGHGIFRLKINSGRIFINNNETTKENLIDRLTNTRCLIQETVTQHPLMSSLHPESINTIRLVTVRDNRMGHNHEPVVFPSILRVGTGKSIIDNTSQGGLAIGIDLESGRLKEFGFYKPEYGTKVSHHPDSNTEFASFTIPFFRECCRQACFLHSFLPGINSIGWDIAVGPEGPIFIEGNDNWEINGPQICNGGLKKRFVSYIG